MSYKEPDCGACPDAKINSLRKLATQQWLEKSGVFNTEPTKNLVISKKEKIYQN